VWKHKSAVPYFRKRNRVKRSLPVTLTVILSLVAFEPVMTLGDGIISVQSGRRSLAGGIGTLSGNSTYRIGGNVQYGDGSSTVMHFPISELVFPLDLVMLRLHGRLELSDPWSVELDIDKNLTTDAGSMEDSDWLSPGVRAIYSESDSDLDALIVDAKVKRQVLSRDKLDLELIGGLKYESFSFECANTVQTSILAEYSGSASGLVLTYDLTYTMPYVAIAGKYEMSPGLKLSASLGYAPYVLVEDQDSHLARSPQKFSDGSYEGSAVLFSLGAQHFLQNGWFVRGNIDVVTIQADGDQDVRSGSSSWTIDAEIESSQTMATVVMGRFL